MSVVYGLGVVMVDGGLVVVFFKGLSMVYMIYLVWWIICLSVKLKGEVVLLIFWEGFLIYLFSLKIWVMNMVVFMIFLVGNGLNVYENVMIFVVGFMFGGLVFYFFWVFVGVLILVVIGEGLFMCWIIIIMVVGMLVIIVWVLLLL